MGLVRKRSHVGAETNGAAISLGDFAGKLSYYAPLCRCFLPVPTRQAKESSRDLRHCQQAGVLGCLLSQRSASRGRGMLGELQVRQAYWGGGEGQE